MQMRYVTDFDRTFAALEQLRRRMDRAFDEFDGGRAARRDDDDDVFPRARLKDEGAKVLVEVEVPGVSEKDLQLTIHQDVLSISGERRSDAPEGFHVHRRERAPIKFARTFALPCKVDVERASALLKNGVMTVELPKAPEAQPRQISVRAE
ncbi:MAG TPA: Hsp20/alpha crystallin family protein [Minicystis sp.]|nr:Hsp20/alpha crystallin family protein [Minicystis sp.]